MKIGGMQPFTLSDYPGLCAAIIFTLGCNFRCSYCHNKRLLNNNAKPISNEQVFEFLNAKRGKLDGIVISGGEPTLQPDLHKMLQQIKSLQYQIKLDTNGTNPNVLKKLMDRGLVDYIAMDIKAPMFAYHKLAGVPVITSDIEKSIDIIINSGINHMFRTTWDKTLLTQSDIDAIQVLLPKSSNFVLQDCKVSG